MKHVSRVPLSGVPTIPCRVVVVALVMAVAAGWLVDAPVATDR